jgi:hypothetical protein
MQRSRKNPVRIVSRIRQWRPRPAAFDDEQEDDIILLCVGTDKQEPADK